MRKNQKAFTVIEILLIVVALGLVVGLGAFVYMKRSDKPKTNNTSTSTPEQPTASNQATPTLAQNSAQYENEEARLSFTYPKDWKAVDSPSKGLIFGVRFNSPDYVANSDNTQAQPEKGGVFSVSANQSDFKDTAEFKARYTGPGMYKTSMQDTTVAGIPALRDNSCDGSRICVIFVRNSVHYGVVYSYSKNENSANAKYLEEYTKLLNSIVLK